VNAAETVRMFNARYPVGTPVVAYPDVRPEFSEHCERIETVTRTKAWLGGGHTPVVMVDGHGAWIALTHIDPVVEEVAS
jgi:hypothetical protein